MINGILQYSFLQNAIISGVILGIILPIIGMIVLLRKLPFIADALGHINMSAIAFIYMLNALFAISQFSSIFIIILWSIIGSVLIEYISQKYIHYKDVSIMIVYSVALSLTMIFLSLSTGFNDSFFDILFGNMNAISDTEVIVNIIVSLLIILVVYFDYKKILIISIEEDTAKLYGVKLKFQRYLTIILISLGITVSIKILGVLLVSSLILIPNLCAMRLTKSLKSSLIMSIIITEICMIGGFIISYYLDMPSSAIIVLMAVSIYCVSLIKRKK